MNKEITSLILKAYNIYKKECLQKEFLYIFKNKNKIEGISIEFSMNNFIHLTGIKNYNKKNMLYKLKNNEISSEKIFVDKFTFLKLYNFEKMIEILKNNNLYISEHDSKKSIKLIVDKLVGNENVTLGIGQNKIVGKYFPKSFLIESITTRSKEENIYKVEAIFCKNVKEEKFTNFTYINNNMLKTLINNEDFKEVVDEKLYKKLVIKIEKITTEKSKEIDDDWER